MRKLAYSLLCLFFVGLSFSSCSNDDCTTCTCLGIEDEICEDDYDTTELYDAAVEAADILCECD